MGEAENSLHWRESRAVVVSIPHAATKLGQSNQLFLRLGFFLSSGKLDLPLPFLACPLRATILPRCSGVSGQDGNAVGSAHLREVSLEFGSRIYHDDLWHSKNACPGADERIVRVLGSFPLVSADFANQLEASVPTDTVEPVVFAAARIWDLYEVKANYVVESVGLWHCCRSAGFG